MGSESDKTSSVTRIGDEEREETAKALADHLARGRISHAEFDERLAATFAARVIADLEEIVSDLPVLKPAELAEEQSGGSPSEMSLEQPSGEAAGPARSRTQAAAASVRIALAVVAPLALVAAGLGTTFAIVNGHLYEPAASVLGIAGALVGLSILLASLLRALNQNAKFGDTA